ncbi:MAG: amidohydrolase family protein [Stellaceae bacterium]
MPIVDAQIHLWSNHLPNNPAHRQVLSYSAEECLKDMDAAGVDAALIHPPGWDPDSGAIAEAAARKYPDRFAILGNFPPDKPESRDLIAGWKRRPGMLGLRWAFTQPHQQTWMTDGTMDWLWPAAEKAGVPIALMASNFLPQVARVAERHPALKLIIDHFGRVRSGPSTRSGGAAAFANSAEVAALARFPNVALKATGAPGESGEAYPYRDIQPSIRRLYDAFGPRRFFWGTDITRMPCPWRQCVTMFTEEVPWLTGSDRDLVMGRAVCDWLGWTLPV